MVLVWICILSFGTSLISGVFGMAGGMIMIGALPFFFSPGQSIFLHGIIQGFANLHRSYELRRGIDWRGIRYYALGSLIAYLFLRTLQFIPSRPLLYLFLGVVALTGAFNVFPAALGFQKRVGAFLCGLSVSGVQLVAGVAGPLLDLFFRDRSVAREVVVGTKAATQAMSHGLKVALMAEILRGREPVMVFGLAEFALILGFSAAGTMIGKRGLMRMSNADFYSWTARILGTLSIFYLIQALQLGLYS